MEFNSILFGNHPYKLEKKEPAFFQDLQLDYILRLISNSVRGYHIAPYYYTLPGDREVIEFRQQVLKDLSDEKLFDCIREFCKKVQRSRQLGSYIYQCEETMQKASYHLEAAKCYWEALKKLKKDMGSCFFSSDGMKAFQAYVHRCIEELKARGFEEAIERASDFFAKIRFQLVIEQDSMTITEGEGSGENYLEGLADLVKAEKGAVQASLYDIYPNSLEQSVLESVLIKMLKKSNPDIFRELKSFYENYSEFYSEKILCFEEEVQFYLSFILFARRTEDIGFSLQFPSVSDGDFFGSGLYDLALAWKNGKGYHIVSNEFAYSEKAAFFVVTGPNQGGKTTFARSMGQAVYFAMMGLKGNALTLTVPMFEGLATHFEAEETLLSNSGKLKEEIDRLVPMMQQEKRRQFVILNELFTTATTYDAMIMGKKVMAHFIGRDCYGIYVTHIQELAEESESIVSLVAQLEEGEEEKRTYRILPMKAQGHGYTDSLVKEFELRYEDILRRLG